MKNGEIACVVGRVISWSLSQWHLTVQHTCNRRERAPVCRLTGSWQKTSHLSSEQQLNLVKLLSPTHLRQWVHNEGNTYFCNSDCGLPLRFTEFNDNGDLVRPLPRNRYLRAGNCFPALVRERHR